MTCKKPEVTYASALKKAQDIDETGIEDVRMRRAVTGGIVFEIKGSDHEKKADVLAEKLHDVLNKHGVSIVRPVQKAAIKVKGLSGTKK